MDKPKNWSFKINWNLLVLCLTAGGIPFPINIGNIAVIIGLLILFYEFLSKKEKADLSFLSSSAFILPVLFFGYIISSTLFSDDVNAGLKQVEKNLFLILLPFVVGYTRPLNEKEKNIVLSVFSFSSILSFLVLLVVGAMRIFAGADTDVLFFHELGSFFDLHPVYIAINLGVTIYFLTFHFKGQGKVNLSELVFLTLTIGIALIGLLLCASKAVLIIFMTIYFIKLVQGALRKRIFPMLILGIILLCGPIFMNSLTSDRFSQGLTFDLEPFEPTNDIGLAKVFSNDEKEQVSDLEIRYLMFKIGLFHVIDDGRLLFGYGIGDVQKHIDFYYMQYGLAPNWFEGYNLHNQYLQYLVSYGILGLLLFLIYLGYSVYCSIKNKSGFHLFFLILILSIFVFECVLSRNKGIVVFIFMNTFFIMNYENSHTRN